MEKMFDQPKRQEEQKIRTKEHDDWAEKGMKYLAK